ncbi:MAG: DegT/DnrJ/EryC1/StrS family aminotransferase [Lachnospiraceae bacterium]
MQFRDLKAQYETLQEEIDAAMTKVITDCNFISGAQVSALEQELAEYVGVKHCVTCGNGTDALSMMLMAWGIKEGEAVFVPDFTFFASGEVVSFEGATPVFYDVKKETFNADTLSLETAIKEVIQEGILTPRVIIAVDLFGQPADYVAIEQIAKKYNLLVLEDGAQGFGGAIQGKRACSFGDAATTSFFPAKPLGCYGDGGAIFTNDDKVADYLTSIRVHGKGTFKYDNIRIGWNSRLDTLQAAILQVKFQAFKQYEIADINIVAKKYTKLLHDVVAIPVVPEGFYSSWAQYTLRLSTREERDGLQEYLKEQGIPTMVYYPKSMHTQLAFKGNKDYVDNPITEQLSNTVLSLPIHPYMKDSDIHNVVDAIKDYFKEGK